MTRSEPDPRRWQALAVVGTAFFMTILDVAIVNVALPSIARDLEFSQENLQWVITAYAIAFGGVLLLGGRLADLLGRRRVFMVGLALFTVASLVCGLAWDDGVLIAARAIQGLGAGIISPAALAIVTTSFTEGAERNKALGIWGALGGSGAAAGVLFGGILTEYLGWEWIFFVNVPVGLAVLTLTRPIVRPSARPGARNFDVAGAALITAHFALLVYTISKAPQEGWTSARTLGLLALAAAMLAAWVAWELRRTEPLVPFSIFRVRSVTGANVVGFLLGAAIYANFFVLTLYVQNVLGWSAIRTGLTFLATAGTTVIWAGVSQALVTRLGAKPILIAGLLVTAAAVLGYTRLPVDGHFWPDLLPSYLVFAVGIAFSFIPVTIAALAGVEPHLAGLASGLINTNQQIGGAVGVAVASTIFISYAGLDDDPRSVTPQLLTEGFQRAFWMIVVVALAGALAAALLLRREELVLDADAEPVRSTV